MRISYPAATSSSTSSSQSATHACLLPPPLLLFFQMFPFRFRVPFAHAFFQWRIWFRSWKESISRPAASRLYNTAFQTSYPTADLFRSLLPIHHHLLIPLLFFVDHMPSDPFQFVYLSISSYSTIAPQIAQSSTPLCLDRRPDCICLYIFICFHFFFCFRRAACFSCSRLPLHISIRVPYHLIPKPLPRAPSAIFSLSLNHPIDFITIPSISKYPEQK